MGQYLLISVGGGACHIPYHLCILATFHGLDKDGIAVDFDHHHDVFVAALRMCRELARLVREHGFAYLVCFGVYMAYFLAMELRGVACFEWDRSFFGGVYFFLVWFNSLTAMVGYDCPLNNKLQW